MPLSDVVAVSGLLLTLTTFLFNLAWPKLQAALELDEKQPGPLARKRSRKQVITAFFSRALPLTATFVALFYVNLPATVRIMRGSRLDLWDFDVGLTLYVLVDYALLAFALLNVWLTARLIVKWRHLR
ncbi:hypothetical protein PS918_05118 [Pseudomonas fluorescens]|uniref:Transmembrane protein n=1 Tax=Pseudomonas fluorescens TaxID=294 RepID=A0A5E7UQ76_PSEFL|nr:hypothetical protein [Pseudomonas fluorescens]VVQ09684.1 hypothetical protein PS918_05118 [Pseudomonas fluorescens]